MYLLCLMIESLNQISKLKLSTWYWCLTSQFIWSHQVFLHVLGHVQAERERKVSVYFLLHHGHHVKCVAHGVETEDPGKFLETGPEIHSDQQIKYTGV